MKHLKLGFKEIDLAKNLELTTCTNHCALLKDLESEKSNKGKELKVQEQALRCHRGPKGALTCPKGTRAGMD